MIDGLNALWNNGVTGREATSDESIHTDGATMNRINPWFQVDLGTEGVEVNSVSIWNRPGQECRLYSKLPCSEISSLSNRFDSWEEPDEGAIVGVSDTPCSADDAGNNSCDVSDATTCFIITKYNLTDPLRSDGECKGKKGR